MPSGFLLAISAVAVEFELVVGDLEALGLGGLFDLG